MPGLAGRPAVSIRSCLGGPATLLPGGAYKLGTEASEELWWAVKMRRFELGEIDEFDPTIRRYKPDKPRPQ